MPGVLIVSVFIACVGVFIALVIRAEKRRKQRQREALDAAGVSIRHGLGLKDDDSARYFFERIGALRGLRTGAKGVRLAGLLRTQAREITLLEHSYTVSSGKNSHEVRHAVAAVEAPAHWPELRVTPEGIFRKLAELVGMKDIRLENAEFNERWRVKCDDEDFAVVVLSPELQAWLVEWPRDLFIVIGQGAVAVAASGRLTPERLPLMIRLVVELADQIPPELEDWGAEDAGAAGPGHLA